MKPACVLIVALCFALSACGDEVKMTKDSGGENTSTSRPSEKAGGAGMKSQPIKTHGEAGGDPFAVPEEGGVKAPTSKPTSKPTVITQLAGTIDIDPSVKLPERYVLFVISGFPGSRSPLAVTRHVNPKFPFQFRLSAQDSQMGGDPNGQPIELRTILTESGDIMPSGNGLYIRSTSEGTFKPGTTDAKLTIKKP